MHFWQNFFKQKQETAKQNILKPLWLKTFLAKTGGRTATKNSRPKDIFNGPFWLITQNFRPTGNSGQKKHPSRGDIRTI